MSPRIRILAVAAALVALPAAANAQVAELPEGVTPVMVEEGRALFTGAGQCFTCHGQDGTGTGLAPDLTDQEWLHIEGGYDELVELITAGVPQPKEAMIPMIPKGGSDISEEEVAAVAAYVWTLSRE